MHLESCNLDTILMPTESFENSYLKKVCPLFPFRQRCNEDDTDFAMVFNLERQSSNMFFPDPVNSEAETIQVTGSPQTQGINGDIYFYKNRENDQVDDEAHKNRTPPILGIVSDSGWLFQTGQLAEYEKAKPWNETLAKHSPETFAKLSGLVQSQ
jgi:hypothetical protein